MFVGKAEKVVQKIASQAHSKGDVATQQTYRRYFASCNAIIFREDRLEAKTHSMQWVDFVKVKRAKLKQEPSRSSLISFNYAF